MAKRRLSYSTIYDLLEAKCPEDDVNDLWLLYRHGFIGAAPIGEIPQGDGTRLWVHGAYFSDERLDGLRARIDLAWEEPWTESVSFDVLRYQQWLTLEETTSLIFYKRKLAAQEAHMWQNRMSGRTGGRIEKNKR